MDSSILLSSRLKHDFRKATTNTADLIRMIRNRSSDADLRAICRESLSQNSNNPHLALITLKTAFRMAGAGAPSEKLRDMLFNEAHIHSSERPSHLTLSPFPSFDALKSKLSERTGLLMKEGDQLGVLLDRTGVRNYQDLKTQALTSAERALIRGYHQETYTYTLRSPKRSGELTFIGTRHGGPDGRTLTPEFFREIAVELVMQRPTLIFVELDGEFRNVHTIADTKYGAFFDKCLGHDFAVIRREDRTDFLKIFERYRETLFTEFKKEFPNPPYEKWIPLFYAYCHDLPIESEGEIADRDFGFVYNQLVKQYSCEQLLAYRIQERESGEKESLPLFLKGDCIFSVWKETHEQPNWKDFWSRQPPEVTKILKQYEYYSFKPETKEERAQLDKDFEELYSHFQDIMGVHLFSETEMQEIYRNFLLVREENMAKRIFDRLKEGQHVVAVFGAFHAQNQEAFWRACF